MPYIPPPPRPPTPPRPVIPAPRPPSHNFHMQQQQRIQQQQRFHQQQIHSQQQQFHRQQLQNQQRLQNQLQMDHMRRQQALQQQQQHFQRQQEQFRRQQQEQQRIHQQQQHLQNQHRLHQDHLRRQEQQRQQQLLRNLQQNRTSTPGEVGGTTVVQVIPGVSVELTGYNVNGNAQPETSGAQAPPQPSVPPLHPSDTPPTVFENPPPYQQYPNGASPPPPTPVPTVPPVGQPAQQVPPTKQSLEASTRSQQTVVSENKVVLKDGTQIFIQQEDEILFVGPTGTQMVVNCLPLYMPPEDTLRAASSMAKELEKETRGQSADDSQDSPSNSPSHGKQLMRKAKSLMSIAIAELELSDEEKVTQSDDDFLDDNPRLSKKKKKSRLNSFAAHCSVKVHHQHRINRSGSEETDAAPHASHTDKDIEHPVQDLSSQDRMAGELASNTTQKSQAPSQESNQQSVPVEGEGSLVPSLERVPEEPEARNFTSTPEPDEEVRQKPAKKPVYKSNSTGSMPEYDDASDPEDHKSGLEINYLNTTSTLSRLKRSSGSVSFPQNPVNAVRVTIQSNPPAMLGVNETQPVNHVASTDEQPVLFEAGESPTPSDGQEEPKLTNGMDCTDSKDNTSPSSEAIEQTNTDLAETTEPNGGAPNHSEPAASTSNVPTATDSAELTGEEGSPQSMEQQPAVAGTETTSAGVAESTENVPTSEQPTDTGNGSLPSADSAQDGLKAVEPPTPDASTTVTRTDQESPLAVKEPTLASSDSTTVTAQQAAPTTNQDVPISSSHTSEGTPLPDSSVASPAASPPPPGGIMITPLPPSPVTIDGRYIERSGWLNKLSHRKGMFGDKWQKRYFVLNRSWLYYFKKYGDSNPRGVIRLLPTGWSKAVAQGSRRMPDAVVTSSDKGPGIMSVLRCLAVHRPNNFAASLSTLLEEDGVAEAFRAQTVSVSNPQHSSRTFYMTASSNDERDSWIKAINNNILTFSHSAEALTTATKELKSMLRAVKSNIPPKDIPSLLLLLYSRRAEVVEKLTDTCECSHNH